MKLIINYNKFKTSSIVINNNSTPSIRVLQKTDVKSQFKSPLGDSIPEKQQYIYRFKLNYPIKKTYNKPFWYQFHSTTCKKNIHAWQLNFRKFLPKTTILEQQNN